MESAKIRERLVKRKRNEEERREAPSQSDDDIESYNKDAKNTVIPGRNLFPRSTLVFGFFYWNKPKFHFPFQMIFVCQTRFNSNLLNMNFL